MEFLLFLLMHCEFWVGFSIRIVAAIVCLFLVRLNTYISKNGLRPIHKMCEYFIAVHEQSAGQARRHVVIIKCIGPTDSAGCIRFTRPHRLTLHSMCTTKRNEKIYE